MAGMFLSLTGFVRGDYERDAVKRLSGIHELLTYPVVPLMLTPVIGPWVAIVATVVPVLWYIACSLILYRKSPGFRLPAVAE